MANITAAMVKELRQSTGVGMMECKKALVENDGDIEKAVLWLRERGLSRAAKKAGRAAAEGTVSVKCSDDCSRAVAVELNCETDFSARNEEFTAFANTVTQLALDEKLDGVDALNAASLSGMSVEDQLKHLIAKVGENMTLRRAKLVTAPAGGFVATYIHMGGKIGVIVGFKGTCSAETQSVANDVAMHVAACSPRYLKRDQVSATELEQEKDLAAKKLREQGKPEEMIEKILVGQLNKFYGEICLVDQPFVKEPKLTVAKFAKDAGLEVVDFVRFQLGEGVEVEKGDFAAEVAAQLK